MHIKIFHPFVALQPYRGIRLYK